MGVNNGNAKHKESIEARRKHRIYRAHDKED